MQARTFRSRWVVRWGIVFGGLCAAVAVILFVNAYRQSQHRSTASADAVRNAQQCEEQIATGGDPDDGACAGATAAGTDPSAQGYLSAGVLLVVGLTQLVGAVRVGVTLTGTGVIVRNPLRTYRLRWGEIADFRTEVGQTGPMAYAFGRVDLRNGDSHRIEGICAMPWESKDTFRDRRVIDALNDELAARQAEAPATATETAAAVPTETETDRPTAAVGPEPDRAATGAGSGTAERDVVDDDGGAAGATGEPLAVGPDLTDVE